MSKKIISNREVNKYYSLGILFLLILIFSSLNTDNAQAAVKQINIGPLLTDTSKVLMGISGSKVGIGIDPGIYNLYVNGTTNISSTTSIGGALNVTGTVTAGSFSGGLSGALSSANVSAGTFGSNTGGGNYSFPASLGVSVASPDAKIEIGGGEAIDEARLIFAASDASNRFTVETDLDGTTTNDLLGFRSSSIDNILVLKGNGNVGIGLTNPASALDVNSAAITAGYWLDGKAALTGESTDNWLRLNASSSWASGTYIPSILRVDGEFRQGSADAGTYGIQTSGSLYSATGAVLAASSGNVGIGTTNPGTKLEISNQAVFNQTTPGTALYGLHFNGQATADYANGITWNGGSSGAQAGLYVQGSGAYGTKMYFATTDSYATGAKTRMMIDHVGNVGIGTTNPTAKLQIIGSGSASSMLNNLAFFGSPASAVAGELYGIFIDKSGYGGLMMGMNKNTVTGEVPADSLFLSSWGGTQPISFGRGGNNGLPNSVDIFINSVGNIGIGTTTPGAYKLFVNGNTNINGTLTATTFSGAMSGTLSAANVSSAAFGANTGGGNYNFPGSVGIGTTTPAYALEVVGTGRVSGTFSTGATMSVYSTLSAARFTPTSATVSGNSMYLPAANSVGFSTNGLERVRIDASGNVGIGTTNPTSKLYLNGGDIKLADTLAATPFTIKSFSGATSLWFIGASGPSIALGESHDWDRAIELDYVPGTTGTAAGLLRIGQTQKNNANFTHGVTAFNTNGLERMRVDSSGNVGIGTTNPMGKMHLIKASTVNDENQGGFVISSGVANTNAKLILGTIGDSYSYIQSMQQNTDWGTRPLILQPNNGNVGIGTTTPGAYKLYVNGNTNINGSITATTFTGALAGSLSAANVSAAAFGANTGGGNYSFPGSVGIGAPAPVSKFNIRRDGTSLSSDNFITISNRVSGVTGHVIGGILFDAYRDVRDPSNVAGIWSERTAYAGGLASDGNLVFGTELNNGRNITTDSSLPSERMRITPAGYVGIGTTAPDAPLHAKGGTAMTSGWNRTATLEATYPGLIFNSNNTKWAGILYDHSSNFLIKVGATSNDVIASGVNALAFNGTSGAATFGSTVTANGVVNANAGLSQDSNVILNGTDTWLRTAGATGWYSTTYGGGWYMTDSTYIRNYGSKPVYITGNATNPSLTFTNSGTYAIDAGGARVGNITSSLDTDAASVAYVKAATITSFNTATTTAAGGLNMNGKNIINVNKLTVNTIDPLYSINGVKYSTFASSISGGVKEEYVGKTQINSKNSYGEYERVIDFDKIEKGSDLWVWRKVIDFNKDSVDISFVPYGKSAQVYYLISGNKLIFRSDKQVEISYRLIARRFDWRNWPTLADDQTEPSSMIIND